MVPSLATFPIASNERLDGYAVMYLPVIRHVVFSRLRMVFRSTQAKQQEMYDFKGSDILPWERPVLVSPNPAPEAAAPVTPDICPTCGSETMRGFGKGKSASYGVFVACETARCDRYVKQAATRVDELM